MSHVDYLKQLIKKLLDWPLFYCNVYYKQLYHQTDPLINIPQQSTCCITPSWPANALFTYLTPRHMSHSGRWGREVSRKVLWEVTMHKYTHILTGGHKRKGSSHVHGKQVLHVWRMCLLGYINREICAVINTNVTGAAAFIQSTTSSFQHVWLLRGCPKFLFCF